MCLMSCLVHLLSIYIFFFFLTSGSSTEPLKLEPQTSQLYTWDNPTGKREVTWSCGKKEAKSALDQVTGFNLVSPYTHITVCYPTDQFGFSLHPHYCLLSHWSIWFLPTPTLLFVIPLINLVSPYTHITVCYPTDKFGFSLHPHYCL